MWFAATDNVLKWVVLLLKIKVEVWVKKVSSEPIGERYCVTDAVFTFVAVDADGKSRSIPREGNHELEQALKTIEELHLSY